MEKIIVVGAGGIGERHVRCFQKLNVGRVGIVEANEERRSQISRRYECIAFASCEEALEADSWTAGVISTPTPSHIPLSLKLLQNGLDILIEKPLSTSLEGIADMRAFDPRIKIRVAYVYRHMALVQELKKVLDGGRLGVPLSGQVIAGQDFSLARPDYASLYYARHSTGGGAIQDLLTHFTNAMDWLVGSTRCVQGLAGNRKLRDVAVEDTACFSALHGAGCLVSYYICQGQAPLEVSLTVHCENGSIRADISNSRIGEIESGATEWTWQRFGPYERDDFYIRQAEAFLDMAKVSPDSSCTLNEAIHSLNVNLAALESVESGRAVYLK